MFQSGGVLVKSPTVLWSGTPATWQGWPTSLAMGNRWVSYSELYRRQHWVRTCVDKRGSLLSRLPLKVYEQDDLNRPEARDHPYARLLARPNQRHSRFFFWLWMQSTFDVYGEAFAGKIRDAGGRPVQLAPMHPSSMREVDERDGRTLWTFDNGRVRIEGIPDEDLFHPRNYNPDSTTRGLSKLESLRATLENEDAALRAQSSFWRKGARPGFALSHPKTLSKPAADRLRLQWDELHAGADNTGTTVILEEGMKPEPLTINNEDAQYIDSRKINREEVVAAYDMPPPAVHILDRATFSNITEQLRSIYRDTMAPVCVFWEGELETQVRDSIRPGNDEPDFGSGVYAEWLLDGVLRGDFEQRAEAMMKAINSGQMTPAEARRMENRPFIEGSDRLFINSTMVPLIDEGTDGDGLGPEERRARNLVEMIQKVYLGVGVVLSAEEARALLNRAGADLASAMPRMDDATLRTVMGRLSRQKSLDDIDADALVAGLNGHADIVRAELEAARAAGDDVPGFRARLKTLEVPCESE